MAPTASLEESSTQEWDYYACLAGEYEKAQKASGLTTISSDDEATNSPVCSKSKKTTQQQMSPICVLKHLLPGHHTEDSLSDDLMRFDYQGKDTVEDQFYALNLGDRYVFQDLLQRWKDHCARRKSYPKHIPKSWFFRFLRHTRNENDSSDGFQEDRAFKLMVKLLKNDRYLKLRVSSLNSQLQSKTLFPVPGLKTSDGHDMFYMRPSRYVPKETSTKTIIDNLVYVMNTMLEKEKNQKHGIGFIACMDDWKMKNFEVNYCYQFMMALQGAMVPVKVQLFLIVNPPTWFGAIWRIMKGMLLPSFRRKVKICNEDAISKYLKSDYQKFLPDDMKSGTVPTDKLVADFIAYREHVEGIDDTKSVTSRSQFSFDSSQSSSHYEETSTGIISRESTFESVADEDDDDDASINADIDAELEIIHKQVDDILETGW
jgi:hypothetical protein